jgi:electron transfer flavoprotein alpha subunit
MAGILVFAETEKGKLKNTSLEAVGAAHTLAGEVGGEVTALVLGASCPGLQAELGGAGAAKILCCSAPALEQYTGDGYARAAAEAIGRVDPQAVLFPATATGSDLAPRVAALLDAGMASDCIELVAGGGGIEAVRPIYAGKARITVKAEKGPLIATLRPNAFETVAAGLTATHEEIPLSLAPEELKDRVLEVVKSAGDKVPLTEAKKIVSGGRGLKGPENFKLIEELAAALGPGTTVGASRSVVDEGWRPHADQVGQTGKTVSPVLYLAVGISGAIQHLAGMSSSKVVVAINKDPEAPIFKVADYGIVGDLFEVVPALTEALRAEN